MLNKLTVYGPYSAIPPLVLNLTDIPESDLFEVRNIDGLNAVKANINTSPYAAAKGEDFVGSTTGKRNIVLTLGVRPDWNTWTYTQLRRKLDSYFMPEMIVTLIFEGDEQAPVVIAGHVESNEPTIFSKEPEHQISIICPQPDFVAVDPVIINGYANSDTPETIEYNGTIEIGFNLEIDWVSGVAPGVIQVQKGSPLTTIFELTGAVLIDETKKLIINSVTLDKYVHTIDLSSGDITNYMRLMTDESVWPTLTPGENILAVHTNSPDQTFVLTYFERFGSL